MRLTLILIVLAVLAPRSFAQDQSDDPYIWLEEVEGAYASVLESARTVQPRYVVIMGNRPQHRSAVEDLLVAMGDRYAFEREFAVASDAASVYRRID